MKTNHSACFDEQRRNFKINIQWHQNKVKVEIHREKLALRSVYFLFFAIIKKIV
jgi:hypothetical protein